jgi:hypothetical protein
MERSMLSIRSRRAQKASSIVTARPSGSGHIFEALMILKWIGWPTKMLLCSHLARIS